jgi:hypothetical protein
MQPKVSRMSRWADRTALAGGSAKTVSQTCRASGQAASSVIGFLPYRAQAIAVFDQIEAQPRNLSLRPTRATRGRDLRGSNPGPLGSRADAMGRGAGRRIAQGPGAAARRHRRSDAALPHPALSRSAIRRCLQRHGIPARFTPENAAAASR